MFKVGDIVRDREIPEDGDGKVVVVNEHSVVAYYDHLGDVIEYFFDESLADQYNTFPTSDIRVLTPLDDILK